MKNSWESFEISTLTKIFWIMFRVWVINSSHLSCRVTSSEWAQHHFRTKLLVRLVCMFHSKPNGTSRISSSDCVCCYQPRSFVYTVSQAYHYTYSMVSLDNYQCIHFWCNKGHGVYYPVCGTVHIKEPLLLIGKSSSWSCGIGFLLLPSEWTITIHPTPNNHK